ncbi:MAG: DNA replication/repair protein RecF [Gemmatimonadota bacterium]|nr:DNA replication/repair protein RecF [Gemmatimonadota bacterium]
MYLTALKLVNYRNFDAVDFEFPGRKTAVCAENGAGKSNLLEAVYFLAIARSGRGSRDRDVVRWGAEYFTIEAGVVCEDRLRSIRIAFDRRAGKKKALLDTAPLPRLSSLVGTFNAVLFFPEDVDLVLRDPPQRRRLLDILVSQSKTSYLSDLDQYRRVLAQRNRLLKEGQGRAPDARHLAPWDVQLAALGARIIRDRLDALDAMRPQFDEYYRQISRGSEQVGCVYRSPVSADERDRGREILEAALKHRRADEADLGYTLVGPHRDNLVFTLDSRSAHKFASKGQLKSILLAWKLAEAAYLKSHTGSFPVLLMDDVFAELDRHRSDAAMELVTSFGQVFITAAREPGMNLEDRGFQLVTI